jgi:hypothetical protein
MFQMLMAQTQEHLQTTMLQILLLISYPMILGSFSLPIFSLRIVLFFIFLFFFFKKYFVVLFCRWWFSSVSNQFRWYWLGTNHNRRYVVFSFFFFDFFFFLSEKGNFNCFPMFSHDGKTLAWESDRGTTIPGEINIFKATWIGS